MRLRRRRNALGRRPSSRGPAALVLALVTHASAAHADPPALARATDARSYAGDTLLVDAASVATSAVS